jgi:hypothetical protein
VGDGEDAQPDALVDDVVEPDRGGNTWTPLTVEPSA